MSDSPAFTCPRCGQRCSGTVFNSRELDGYRWRRRTCEHCGRRFSTVELLVPPEEDPMSRHNHGGARNNPLNPQIIHWR